MVHAEVYSIEMESLLKKKSERANSSNKSETTRKLRDSF